MQSSGLPAIGLFEQPVLTIGDGLAYSAVHSAVEAAFAPSNVGDFLKRMAGKNLRIRNFEDVLGAGLLGDAINAQYGSLGDADRGQIREDYLARLERVAPELRQKFYKLYAYY